MGMKVKGPDLETIDRVGLEIEKLLKEVPMIEPAAVFADRIVGKPYLEIDIDRRAIARYGIMLQDVRAHKFLNKLAYFSRPNHAIKALVDLLVDSNGQFLLHGISRIIRIKHV